MSEFFYASLVEGLSKDPSYRDAQQKNTTNVVFPSYYDYIVTEHHLMWFCID